MASSFRSSSSRYPTHSTAMLSLPALMRLAAAVMEDWYCDSRTTYTIFMVGRPRTSSGTTRRFSALVSTAERWMAAGTKEVRPVQARVAVAPSSTAAAILKDAIVNIFVWVKWALKIYALDRRSASDRVGAAW